MKQALLVLAVMFALGSTGCGQQGAANDTKPLEAAAPGTGVAADDQKDTGMTALKPPSADSVLYMIYQRDGDGAVTYEVDGGATVSYWYGQAFDLKGRHYFTGFSTRTEGNDEPEADAGMMEPGHVAIGQATFVQADEAGKQTWSKVDSDGYVGEFGSNDQGDAVDETRKAQTHDLGDGRLILAVPTRTFAGGVASTAFAMFLFDPDNVDALSFRKWGYLGSVAVGEDNSASCEDGKVTPCATSSGTLSFEPVTESGLPRLKVARSGKIISGPEQVRALGADDAVTYTFDAKAGLYQP